MEGTIVINGKEVNLADLSTPIQAATRLETAPQYLYMMLRNGKVPAEHLVSLPANNPKGVREMLLPSFFEWFATRPTRSSGTTKAAKAPAVTLDDLMGQMAARLEATGNKKFAGLADALKAIQAGNTPAVEA